MAVIPLPKLERCCFCTRKLKVASVLIAFWSMLAITHSMRILYCPTCPKIYTREGGKLHRIMSIIMWILFFTNMATLCSSFFLLLGIFLYMYPVSADIFVVLGIVSAILMIAHAIINLIQIFDSDCKNPSDTFAHLTYGILWLYFVVIVNSYRDEMVNK